MILMSSLRSPLPLCSSLCDSLSFLGKATRVTHDHWHWPVTVEVVLIQCFLGYSVEVFYPATGLGTDQ